MSGTRWTDEENDAVVADYFSMLSEELSNKKYIKAEHNRVLQGKIGRTKGSIEFKHRNISAVLMGLGEAWNEKYKPAFNFQTSLVDAVARYLQEQVESSIGKQAAIFNSSGETGAIQIGKPPTFQNYPPHVNFENLEKMQAIALKFDVAGRDERNRVLGKEGEKRVIRHERAILTDAGRSDLAEKVRWVSQEDGDGAGYDIASFTAEGYARWIEVKTTNGWERTPFHISRNELDVAEANRRRWRLFRLWNFSRQPKAFELQPPLEAHVNLTPTSFRASFRKGKRKFV